MTTVVLRERHIFVDAVYPAGTTAEVATPEETEREAPRLTAAMIREGMVLVRLDGRLRWVEVG
jgi:hypothetical protein